MKENNLGLSFFFFDALILMNLGCYFILSLFWADQILRTFTLIVSLASLFILSQSCLFALILRHISGLVLLTLTLERLLFGLHYTDILDLR